MKNNNKGFSLIELIVVVAIMAVLVGVLAPTYIKYVESTKVQKDESAIGEAIQAVKLACANNEVYNSLTTGTTYALSWSDNATVGDDTTLGTAVPDVLKNELTSSGTSKIDFTSKKYEGKAYKLIIKVETSGVQVADFNNANFE